MHHNHHFSPPSLQAAREVRRNSAIRQARTCYRHLAGVAGVDLMGALLRRGWLEESGEQNGRTLYRLTATGEQYLSDRRVDLGKAANSRLKYAYGCVDWTERRFHLGGALGVTLLDALVDAGVVRREPGSRLVSLLSPLGQWLDNR